MAAEIIVWPCDLGVYSITPFIQWTTRSAGTGMSTGVEQIVGVNAGSWSLRLDFGMQNDPVKIKQFEALVSRMRGRQNIASICICDPFKYDASVAPLQYPYSDGTWHTDGTGFIDSDSDEVQPIVSTNNVPMGGGQFYYSHWNPHRSAMRVGDLFTHENFLYRVTVSGPDDNNFRFEPPARRPMPVGTQIITTPLRAYFRFATDGEGERARERLRFGSDVSLQFVEAFDREDD